MKEQTSQGKAANDFWEEWAQATAVLYIHKAEV